MSAKKGISSTGLLTIDLGAIAANWVYLDRHVGEHCRCAAVVKANAYGLGVVPVATSLWNAGCRVFFVATVVEAKELRAALPYDYQIIVLGGLSHDQGDGCSADWLNYQLMPMLFSVSDVSRWYDFCSSVQQNLPSAIKVDTGMHRLGLQPQECQQLFAEGVLQAVNPTYIMSHLACADQPHHPLNRQQISCFQWLEEQCKMLLPNAQLSLCNSAGIFLGEEVHYDVVRPGIALYGANPSADENPMSPVVQITLPIMQVKTIAEGESVGYGAEFVAQRETRIGIVFGGYADGLQRSLAHAGFAFCGGVKVPLIGRVSMDSMAFDLSDLSDVSEVHVPYVELLGEGQSLDDLAHAAGTIAYEVLTSLGGRYQRRYIEGET